MLGVCILIAMVLIESFMGAAFLAHRLHAANALTAALVIGIPATATIGTALLLRWLYRRTPESTPSPLNRIAWELFGAIVVIPMSLAVRYAAVHLVRPRKWHRPIGVYGLIDAHVPENVQVFVGAIALCGVGAYCLFLVYRRIVAALNTPTPLSKS